MEINMQIGNKNSSQKKKACNKEKYMRKIFLWNFTNLFLVISVLKITPEQKNFSKTMKRMAFHHLYKTLTFARTNSREQDLENNTERKYEQYGSQKKNLNIIWTKPSKSWCISSPNKFH